MSAEETEIERADTLIRILFTLLFVLIGRVVEFVIMVVVLCELLISLLTKKLPADGVRNFANRTVTYLYRIGRYLTYNESDPPFPFADLPAELEPPAWSSRSAESDALGLERDKD
jgi:hypothetical protein